MEFRLTTRCPHRLRPETWFDLAGWTRAYRLVSSRERSLYYGVGLLVSRGKELTVKQTRYLERSLERLMKKLQEAGYALEYSTRMDEPLLYRPCPAGHKVEPLSADQCPECGAQLPGVHPEVVGGQALARARERDQKRGDPRIFHTVCDCGHSWSWRGAHSASRQRCLECGRPATHARYFDGEQVITVPREEFGKLADLPLPDEPEVLTEAEDGEHVPGPPLAWGPSLLDVLLVAAEPPEFIPLDLCVVGQFGEGDYRLDLEEDLLHPPMTQPISWAPVSELLDRAGITEERLTELSDKYDPGAVPEAVREAIAPALDRAFAACARRRI